MNQSTLKEVLVNQTESVNVSKQYSHVTTQDIVKILAKQGFVETAFSSAKTRGTVPGFQRHLLRFSSPDLTNDSFKARGLVPEIVVVNSHDGKSALKLMLGLYRMVCANGLIVGSTFEAINIRHVGDTHTKLLAGLEQVTKAAFSLSDTVERMSEYTPTWDEETSIIRTTLELALPAHASPYYAYPMEAQRIEDQEKDLFTLYNKLQEYVIRGGIKYFVGPENLSGNLRQATTRPIKSIPRQVSANRALWNAASSLVLNKGESHV